MDASSVNDVGFRAAEPADAPRLHAIRLAAFAPVFAAFRSMLGDDLYQLAQRRDDEAQGAALDSMLAPNEQWKVYVAHVGESIAGFVSVRVCTQTHIGEIGLNAVDPEWAGRGIGSAMYEYAARLMREAGMKVATVSTGGDESHAPARRAYRKAGFNAEVPSVWMCRKL